LKKMLFPKDIFRIDMENETAEFFQLSQKLS